MGTLTIKELVPLGMKETQVNWITTFRWKQVLLVLAFVVPAIVLFRILTMPIVGCVDYFADGSQVTHYGSQCLESLLEMCGRYQGW